MFFCSNLIYQKGIERKAQPLERLKKKYAEFQQSNSSSSAHQCLTFPSSGNGKPVEVRGYDSKMIHEGDFSFEEIRAMNWYAKPKISKPTLSNLTRYRTSNVIVPQPSSAAPVPALVPFPTIQTVENYSNIEGNRRTALDYEDVPEDPGLGISVNPDDLTHINVFKDNTADLREISKLVKAKSSVPPPPEKPTTDKKKSDWLLKDLLMSFSPIRKKPHLSEDLGTENKTSSSSNSPVKPKSSTNLTSVLSGVSVTADDIRALPDTIPDIRTDVTMKLLNIPSEPIHVDYSHLMDPFDLDFKIAQCEAVLSQIASAIPNLQLRLDETAGAKVRAFEKSLGRDGSGPNHTVSSLRMASGHFFMEKKLGEGGYGKVFLAVDLMKEDGGDMRKDDGDELTDDGVNQVAIKIEAPASVWESYIIFRIQSHCMNTANSDGSRHFPRLMSASIYSDVSFLVIDYYEQGSLLGVLNVYRQQNNNIDEAIVLFYACELVKSVLILHEAGIIHTDIKLENLLVLTPKASMSQCSATWSSIFRRDGSEGWKERGLVLIDYGRAIDLKLLKDEEGSRFYIKSKHSTFNGSPRIARGLDISHEMDWYGAADCLHWLLHQKGMSLSPTASTADKKTKLLNPFKRYWQTDIWEPLFEDLLNPPPGIAESIAKFTGHFDIICGKLEGWKKTPSLKSLLTRQEIMMYEAKK